MAIFDMDGTIVDSMWIWEALAIRSFTKKGMKVPENLAHEMYAMDFMDAADYCIKASGQEMTKEQLVEEWTRDALLMYDEEITLKPFTRELLTQLKSLGVTLCLTTANYKEVAVRVLERFSLSSLFDSITVTGEVNASKSLPDVFLLTAAKHHIRPDRCVVFEDSYFAVQGAKAAGMSVIGVYDRFAEHTEKDIRQLADTYIYSFEELNEHHLFTADV